MNNQKNNGNFWMGFFLGGLFGAFLIFLWGTKEGKKAAEKILEQGELFEEELEKRLSLLQEKGEALLDEAEEIKSRVNKELELGKQTVSEELAEKMDTALTKLENVQKKGVEITRDFHHRHFKKNGKTLTS